MRADAGTHVKKCNRHQRQVPASKLLTQNLTTITSPWPFAQWDIDIVRPLPTAPTEKKLLLVATDYFSKWIEVQALSSIKDKEVTQFIWENIVCRFGIPQSIVTDNGPQFDSWGIDECKTHICFEFISHVILSILYSYSCKTHKISSKLGFTGFLMENK